MDIKFLTEWFGGAGAVFAVIFGLFKAICPEVKSQLEVRSRLKDEENELRKREQQNTREMIEAVKITNGLVAKNNEAFSNHNMLFSIHVESLKDLKEHQRTIKEDLHRRFDHVEDLLDDGSLCGTKLERDQAAILANLRQLHGRQQFPDREDEE